MRPIRPEPGAADTGRADSLLKAARDGQLKISEWNNELVDILINAETRRRTTKIRSENLKALARIESELDACVDALGRAPATGLSPLDVRAAEIGAAIFRIRDWLVRARVALRAPDRAEPSPEKGAGGPSV